MKIEIDQHYYTDSMTRDGFFTLDQSEGLTDIEVNEIEQKVIYDPPFELSQSRSKSEIASLFPVRNQFFRLKNGRYAFSRVTYTGRSNHTPNRFGNFFAHTIVLQKGIRPELPAIFFFDHSDEKGNSIFRPELSMEDDRNYKKSLRRIQLHINPSQEHYRNAFGRLSSFLNDQGRLHHLTDLFQIINSGWLKLPGTNTIYVDHKEGLNNFCFSANFFLPDSVANELSFCSYISEPKDSPFKLSAVLPEKEKYLSGLTDKYYKVLGANHSARGADAVPSSSLLSRILQSIRDKDFDTWWALIKKPDTSWYNSAYSTPDILERTIDIKEVEKPANTASPVRADLELRHVYQTQPQVSNTMPVNKLTLSALIDNLRKEDSVHLSRREDFYLHYGQLSDNSEITLSLFTEEYMALQKSALQRAQLAYAILTDSGFAKPAMKRPARILLSNYVRIFLSDAHLPDSAEAEVYKLINDLVENRSQKYRGNWPSNVQEVVYDLQRSSQQDKQESKIVFHTKQDPPSAKNSKSAIDSFISDLQDVSAEGTFYAHLEIFMKHFDAINEEMAKDQPKSSSIGSGFWRDFIEYTHLRNNGRLPDVEYLMIVLTVFLIGRNIQLRDVDIDHWKFKISTRGKKTIDYLTKYLTTNRPDYKDQPVLLSLLKVFGYQSKPHL